MPYFEWFAVDGSLGAEYALEMVNLVLQQLRHGILQFHFMPLPFFIKISDLDFFMPLNLHEQIRKTHAVIPNFKHLIALIQIFWVDYDDWLIDVEVD